MGGWPSQPLFPCPPCLPRSWTAAIHQMYTPPFRPQLLVNSCPSLQKEYLGLGDSLHEPVVPTLQWRGGREGSVSTSQQQQPVLWPPSDLMLCTPHLESRLTCHSRDMQPELS